MAPVKLPMESPWPGKPHTPAAQLPDVLLNHLVHFLPGNRASWAEKGTPTIPGITALLPLPWYGATLRPHHAARLHHTETYPLSHCCTGFHPPPQTTWTHNSEAKRNRKLQSLHNHPPPAHSLRDPLTLLRGSPIAPPSNCKFRSFTEAM